MSITIGRVGRDATRRLQCPTRWDVTGDQVKLSGHIGAADEPFGGATVDLASALTLRAQLAGYPNDDEPAVPVVFDEDPSVNGWYRIVDSSVTMMGTSLQHGYFSYDMTLERVAGFAAPDIESVLTGAGAVNSFAISGGFGSHAVPAAVDYYVNSAGATVLVERQSADGPILYGPVNPSSVSNWSVDAGRAYIGAAVLRVGNPREVVVGRQVPDRPQSWTLTNGVERLRSVIDGQIEVSCWDAGHWASPKSLVVSGLGGASGIAAGEIRRFTHLVALRNSPEEVAVRLTCLPAFGPSWGPVDLDLRLRRGERFARCYLTSRLGDQWRISLATPEAGADAGPGPGAAMRAAADDAEGNRYFLSSTLAWTPDYANGRLTQTTNNNRSLNFAFGHELRGSAAAVTDRASDMALRYFTEITERQTVVGR